ncbi:MAG: SMC-Scp complex subunit ScpB [Proteobacteria bacterium]|nr:SMC-Scp complex subunit ScpB [Pseudomonadota bacterium]NDC24706.1 SMC-Scp complex subunit ScpB [Pseudomonadota bacterium]NDD04645.1 SMC-Scp complex subunit ScpB [Pseudomonadota bacterium]NDG27067.1 SMC-Scp complex subunit ScpB [Pseudomonadota bacterium]
METNSITSAIESILFAADRPVSIARLLEVFGELNPRKEDIEEALSCIQKRYESVDYGFELRAAQGGFQFTTKANNAEWVRKFLETKPFRLGRSSLEVLAIIAYRQPMTRAEIDAVRGIDSSHLLRTLMERGLVKMAGKAEVPGRPVQYATTPKFLEVLGLEDLAHLPPLSELQQLQGDTEDPIKTLEKGLDRFIAEEPTDQESVGNLDLQKGLDEIGSLIETADRSQDEVYESKEHAEVARANQEALKAYQETTPYRRRKRTMTYNDLHLGETPADLSPEGRLEENLKEVAAEVSGEELTVAQEEPTHNPVVVSDN